MPAICPPVRPGLVILFAPPAAPVEAAPVAVAVVDLVAEEVELVNSGARLEVAATGRTTLLQRVSVLEKTQHESVEFGELAAQYEHRPLRLLEKPQSFGSFTKPCTHATVNEFAGSAQVVKSARICVSADLLFALGVLGLYDGQRRQLPTEKIYPRRCRRTVAAFHYRRARTV
ncbi:hypothetical protein LTR66_014942 [Elasticomyces elasticus]|nr:hypothetical protein LTR66_014942 [Elasticomyces elasticus]